MKKNKITSVINALGSVATCSRLNTLGLSSLGMAGIIALAPLALAPTASAEVTAPVGYVKLTFNAESDTPFSLPMNRPKVYSGQVDSISGNVIAIENDDFTAGELVYDNVDDANGLQLEKYYLLFTTGILEGRTFDVTSNTVNSITVDPDWQEDDPAEEANIQTLINDALATDNFEIRPHWTLNTLFPDGANFPPSSNDNLPAGRLMWRTADKDTATDIGVNISLSKSYFFFDNGNNSFKGWYPFGSFTKSPDDIIRPDVMYVYRNSSMTQYEMNLVGDVPMTDSTRTVNILSDTIIQDNYMTLPFPIETSLADLGILNMPGFKKSTGSTSLPNGDIVQIYAYPTTGINPAPVAQYVYYDAAGTANDAWYKLGNINPGQSVDNLKIFNPGTGYVIRKSEDFESSETVNQTLPYDPFAP